MQKYLWGTAGGLSQAPHGHSQRGGAGLWLGGDTLL